MSVTAFSQYKVYEYVNSGTPALATYTGMTFTQDGTNFLDALNTSSQSVVSMPANYIATCDSNYRYNVSQMTAYSNIGANFPSNGSYEFENQTTKFVLKIKDLRGNIAYSKDLEIDMNTTYFGFFMNSNGIGGVIIYRINDANCDVVIKGNSTFDNMYKTVYTIDGRDPLPDLEGGGAGSGYIGNSLLSNKKMVGYNVPTSSAEGTKTESVNDVSANPVSGKPKSGNGFARIKFLNTHQEYTLEELIKTSDLTHYKETWVGNYSVDDNWSTLSQWLDTDWNLSSQNGYGTYELSKENDEYILGTTASGSMCLYALPLKNKIKVKQIRYDGKFYAQTSSSVTQHHIRLGITNNGTHSIAGALTVAQGGTSFDYIVADTDYHTFTKVFTTPVECNYIEFYNNQYKDYFKNIKILVEV